MEPTGDNHSFVLPPALLAEVEAVADKEHRPVDEVVREAMEFYLRGKRRDRVVRKVREMSAAELELIANSEMDPRHNHLDAELE